MINVDDRLIKEELRKIGVDAFCVLMCITTHLGKSSTAWPGVSRLREMTGLSKDRTYSAIKNLIDAGMVERWQENEKGVWGKVVYRVTTEYLNIYVSASKFTLSEEPLSGIPEYGYPEHGKPESGIPAHISINNREVLISKEVINKKEEREGAPPQNETLTGLEKSPPPCSAPPPSTQAGARNAPDVEEMIEYLECLFLQDKWQPRFINNPPETAEEIHDYYTSNGWKVGRNPMKDWRAACRNWLKNNRTYATKQRSNVSSAPRPERRIVSEDTHRRALAITLAELGITSGQ